MSYTTETTIWCDGCAEWDQLSACGSVRRARTQLKKEKGWSYSGKKDYCPECTRKRKEVRNGQGEGDPAG